MQIVDILRAQEKTLAQLLLQFGQRAMTGIRFSPPSVPAPHAVEPPDPLRIFLPRFRGGYLFHPVSLPEATVVPEGLQSALRADSGPRQHENAVFRPDPNLFR